jgi:putative flippase GtrA
VKIKAIAFKFVVTGGLNSSIQIGVCIALVSMGIHYMVATTVGYGLAVINSFILNKFWTFSNNNKEAANKQFLIFIIINIVSLGLNNTLMFAFVEYLDLILLVAQSLSIIVVMAVNFLSYHLLFSTKKIENDNW